MDCADRRGSPCRRPRAGAWLRPGRSSRSRPRASRSSPSPSPASSHRCHTAAEPPARVARPRRRPARRGDRTRTCNNRFWRPGLCQIELRPVTWRWNSRLRAGARERGPPAQITHPTGSVSRRQHERRSAPPPHRSRTAAEFEGRPSLRDDRRMSTTTQTVASSRRVSARIGRITESATLAVDAKAKAMRAAGRDVIGFGAGEPDFATPAHIVAAAVAACAQPRFHHYTPAFGLPELRAAIAAKTERDSGLSVPAGQVLVTNGGKQAVYQAFAALLDPGDEALLPAPYWTTYPEAIRLAGGVPVEVPTDETTGYLATVDQLEAARTDRTKLLLFCSPSNPTGAVYPREHVEAIGRWAVEHRVWVVTDEIYEHLVYDGHSAPSLPVVVPEMADRCVVVNGVAKTYAMSGWRVGWMIGPRDVIDAAGNLQSHLTSNVANVSQAAALAAVTGDLSAATQM